ncbi:glycosyltransferase [Polymorphospora rubra]|uniref:glycosyltransferase n=1 Tax=Polymorphospora rubra TaxID=338584 RepID=UPI0031E3EA5A
MRAPTRGPTVASTSTHPTPASATLRVAHFSDTYLPRRDGIITSLRTLTGALTGGGHECLTVVPGHRRQPAQPDVLPLPAVPCGVADLRLLPWPTLRQVRRIEAWRPDLVHVHTPGPVGLLGVLTARRLGLPVVHTYHTDLQAYVDAYRIPTAAIRVIASLYTRRLGLPAGSVPMPAGGYDDDRRGQVQTVNALLMGDADAVVVPTAAALDRAALPVPAHRLFVVPSAVPNRAVGPHRAAAFRARYGIGEADRMVLFVGRVNREKGIDLLLPAFAKVVAREPRARLVLVGAVYEQRWLRRLIDGSGVGDRVVVTGQLSADQVTAACATAEVFAFPSSTDTQGLVLQEAALAGVPSVIVDADLHRAGALGDAAVLAEATPDGLAAAVTGLLRDPVRARRTAELARTRALRHTPRRYGAAMLDVYRGALTAHHGG